MRCFSLRFSPGIHSHIKLIYLYSLCTSAFSLPNVCIHSQFESMHFLQHSIHKITLIQEQCFCSHTCKVYDLSQSIPSTPSKKQEAFSTSYDRETDCMYTEPTDLAWVPLPSNGTLFFTFSVTKLI